MIIRSLETYRLTMVRRTHGVVLFLPLLGTTTQTEHQVEGGLLLDVVVAKGAAILELLTSEDETLLVRGDTGE